MSFGFQSFSHSEDTDVQEDLSILQSRFSPDERPKISIIRKPKKAQIMSSTKCVYVYDGEVQDVYSKNLVVGVVLERYQTGKGYTYKHDLTTLEVHGFDMFGEKTSQIALRESATKHISTCRNKTNSFEYASGTEVLEGTEDDCQIVCALDKGTHIQTIYFVARLSLHYLAGKGEDSLLVRFYDSDTHEELFRTRMNVEDDINTSYVVAALTQNLSSEKPSWKLLPILKPNEKMTSIKNVPPTKVLFTLIRGIDLPACDVNGFSDPYVALQWEKEKTPFWKSVVLEKELNPEFEEKGAQKGKKELYQTVIPIKRDMGNLLVQVFDHDIVGVDDKMGLVRLAPNELYPCTVQAEMDLQDFDKVPKKIAKGSLVFKIQAYNDTEEPRSVTGLQSQMGGSLKKLK